MQENKNVTLDNLPKEVFKNILYNLSIDDRENLRVASKYCHTNIDQTDPASLITAILNSSPIAVSKLINRLKKHYPEFYNHIKNTETYDPKNPFLFIIRILIDDDIKTLPLQKIEKVLQQKLLSIVQFDPKYWEKLTASLRMTYEANKHIKGNRPKRSTTSQGFINALENKWFTYSNLANMNVQYTDFNSEKEKISFAYASLVKANFISACFYTFVDFQDANLSKSNFNSVKFLKSVSFQNANLSKTSFLHCNLPGQDSILAQANFENANLEGALFLGERFDFFLNLNVCNFQNAKLHSTQFENVAFYDIDFTEANLSSTQFKNCEFENVKFINFKEIDAAKLKNQLDMLNTCKEQQKNSKDKKDLTKAIFSDFKSKIEKVNDFSTKKRLLETARHPIFGFSSFFTFYPNVFKIEELKWIENQLKDFNANIKPEPK